ncbi:hypothetical protein TNCV_1332041 [Trichonephila clavipes]|nr:hypothetical protein TNCV_1332041 [Trichonephila clavipes]
MPAMVGYLNHWATAAPRNFGIDELGSKHCHKPKFKNHAKNEYVEEAGSGLRIDSALSKNATECCQRFLEACSKNVLPHWKVALEVKTFCSGQNDTVDFLRTGRISIPQDQIDILSRFLSVDLPGVFIRSWYQSSKCVAYKEDMSMRDRCVSCVDVKIAGRCVSHQLTEVRKWYRYGLTGLHMEQRWSNCVENLPWGRITQST